MLHNVKSKCQKIPRGSKIIESHSIRGNWRWT